MAGSKIRLDRLLVEKRLAPSRQRAKAYIMAGKVLVNRVRVDKPGTLISDNAEITVTGEDHPYVSRGGLKLAKALDEVNFRVQGLECLDVGASTGGFTDCLLQHGARLVHAVDVGYGQLAWNLRQDSRVHVIERTNIRNMPDTALPAPVDLVTIDVSFISLKIVVPSIIRFLKPTSAIFALIKPQFEVSKALVGKGGVVRDASVHQTVISELTNFFNRFSLKCLRVIQSPITGPKGNREFIAYLVRSDCGPNSKILPLF